MILASAIPTRHETLSRKYPHSLDCLKALDDITFWLVEIESGLVRKTHLFISYCNLHVFFERSATSCALNKTTLSSRATRAFIYMMMCLLLYLFRIRVFILCMSRFVAFQFFNAFELILNASSLSFPLSLSFCSISLQDRS